MTIFYKNDIIILQCRICKNGREEHIMVTKTSRITCIECKASTYEGNLLSGGSICVEVFPSNELMKELFINTLQDVAEHDSYPLSVFDENRVSASFEISDVFTEKECTWIFISADGDSFQMGARLESERRFKEVILSLWEDSCNELVPSVIRYCYNKNS